MSLKINQAEIAGRILGDLQLGALRTRYRALGSAAEMIDGLSGRFYFYSEPYEFASGVNEKAELSAEAHALNILRSIAKRKSELTADGIFPNVVCSSEPGYDCLALFIEFDERGRRLLKSTN